MLWLDTVILRVSSSQNYSMIWEVAAFAHINNWPQSLIWTQTRCSAAKYVKPPVHTDMLLKSDGCWNSHPYFMKILPLPCCQNAALCEEWTFTNVRCIRTVRGNFHLISLCDRSESRMSVLTFTLPNTTHLAGCCCLSAEPACFPTSFLCHQILPWQKFGLLIQASCTFGCRGSQSGLKCCLSQSAWAAVKRTRLMLSMQDLTWASAVSNLPTAVGFDIFLSHAWEKVSTVQNQTL